MQSSYGRFLLKKNEPFVDSPQIGVIVASLAQAMQCMVVSPRMLHAIAADGTIPLLKNLRHLDGKFKDEPKRALIVTTVICLLGVQIGKLDPVAPMLSACFLVCYGALNLSTAIHSYTHSPDWRPTFRLSHWLIGLVGFVLCAAIAFVINWIYTLVLLIAVAVIALYVAWCDVAVSWGTGVGGLQLKLALRWATQHQSRLSVQRISSRLRQFRKRKAADGATMTNTSTNIPTQFSVEDILNIGNEDESVGRIFVAEEEEAEQRAHVSQWRPQLLIIRRPDEKRTAIRKQ